MGSEEEGAGLRGGRIIDSCTSTVSPVIVPVTIAVTVAVPVPIPPWRSAAAVGAVPSGGPASLSTVPGVY